MSRAVRVAVLHDIHGNLPALEAVLAEVREEAVDRVVVGGDVVPGPMPGECLAALQALPVPLHCIHGNGEIDVLAFHRGEVPGRVPPPFHGVMRWVADRLSGEALAALGGWPRTTRLEVEELGRVLFCHGTPRDENEIFTEVTPEVRLRPVFEEVGADVVVCGHTHMAFDRTVGSVRVVNAGSVGMPFGAPGADWLLLGAEGVAPRHTDYDFDDAARRIVRAGYPIEFDVRRVPSAVEMRARFEVAALRR